MEDVNSFRDQQPCSSKMALKEDKLFSPISSETDVIEDHDYYTPSLNKIKKRKLAPRSSSPINYISEATMSSDEGTTPRRRKELSICR